MSEGLLVRHCSPTLAGMKAGSMFSCSCRTHQELLEYVRQANRVLVPKGIRVVILRYRRGRALIYMFRPKAIAQMLQDPAAVELLKKRGYRELRVEPCICQLLGRFQTEEEFPHEIGLFLGYPPEDVWGFIRNSASNQKCCGCWKVYGDAEAAQKTFEMYKKCTNIYCSLWEQGKSIAGLAVAG